MSPEDILLSVGTSALGVVLAVLTTYVIMKKWMFSYENISETVDSVLTAAATDVETQKKLYIVGAILGNGIKQGIGMNPKTGKFKFDNIIGDALSGFIGNMFSKQGETATNKLPWEA